MNNKAYTKGKIAFHDNYHITDNPFNSDLDSPDNFAAWHKGYLDVHSSNGGCMQKTAWKPMSEAPHDGTDILIKTSTGIVQAWFHTGSLYHDSFHGDEYTPPHWVCYDDLFNIDADYDGAFGTGAPIAWMEIPL